MCFQNVSMHRRARVILVTHTVCENVINYSGSTCLVAMNIFDIVHDMTRHAICHPSAIHDTNADAAFEKFRQIRNLHVNYTPNLHLMRNDVILLLAFRYKLCVSYNCGNAHEHAKKTLSERWHCISYAVKWMISVLRVIFALGIFSYWIVLPFAGVRRFGGIDGFGTRTASDLALLWKPWSAHAARNCVPSMLARALEAAASGFDAPTNVHCPSKLIESHSQLPVKCMHLVTIRE